MLPTAVTPANDWETSSARTPAGATFEETGNIYAMTDAEIHARQNRGMGLSILDRRLMACVALSAAPILAMDGNVRNRRAGSPRASTQEECAQQVSRPNLGFYPAGSFVACGLGYFVGGSNESERLFSRSSL